MHISPLTIDLFKKHPFQNELHLTDVNLIIKPFQLIRNVTHMMDVLQITYFLVCSTVSNLYQSQCLDPYFLPVRN